MTCNITLTFFGDSNTDTNNPLSICRSALDPLLHLKKTASDGKIWSEILPSMTNLDECSNNFAFCGAMSDQVLNNQIPSYFTHTLQQPNTNQADQQFFFLYVGYNDFTKEIYSSFTTNRITENIYQAVKKIHNIPHNNKQTFVIPNLIDAAYFPAMNDAINSSLSPAGRAKLVTQQPTLLKIIDVMHDNLPESFFNFISKNIDSLFATIASYMVKSHNKSLAKTVEKLQLEDNIDIHLVDFHSLFNDIASNPLDYGITNTQQACYLNPNEDITCSSSLMYDFMHQTEKVHQQMAELSYCSIYEYL
jgi:phospholipase/lecithinase/hemolysin